MCQFKVLQDEPGFLIKNSKNNYYSKLSQKLPDKSTGSKTYWSILKTLLGNINIPCIPPVLHDNILVIDFRGKDIFFYIFYIIYLSDTIFFFQSNVDYQRVIVNY